jgi:hypothetical protein
MRRTAVDKPKELTGMLAYIAAARELRCSSVHAKCLLQYYASNVNQHGKFFKSTADISAETRLSESFIRKTNAVWEHIKLIAVVAHPRSDGKANDYSLDLKRLRIAVENAKEDKAATKERARLITAERVRRHRAKLKTVTPPQDVTEEACNASM